MLKLTGLAAELFDEISKLPVIDCHEHLPPEAQRTGKTVDVTTLFSHYCRPDLDAAGLPYGPEQDELFDTARPLGPRWRKFKPFLAAIRHGSYAWPAFAYVRDVLGFEDIDDSTCEAISARLQADNAPGLYRRLLVDRCGIELAIQSRDSLENDQPFFVYLCQDVTCRAEGGNFAAVIARLERLTNRSIHTLAQCVDALGQYVQDAKRAGAVGLKVGAAYRRTLEFMDAAAADAEPVFVKARAAVNPSINHAEREVLENYLFRRQVEACIEVNMPVVIHTGYQQGVRNDIRNARATLLWPLLKDYPRARFDLFHGSFPYVEDMVVLGKYFSNVSLNMCWMHIMGAAISRRALAEWLDAVPVTKIFAFGGDYQVVEKVYGHLQLARANVAAVLADKVAEGRMTRTDALAVARLLFYENPKRWYNLA